MFLNKNNKNMYSQSSGIYFLLLNYLDIKVVEGQEEVVNYIMGIASLSLLGVFCLLNILMYILIIYFINNYKKFSELMLKYPKLNWFVQRYKNMSLIFISLEFLLLFLILLIIFISSMLLIKQMLSV